MDHWDDSMHSSSFRERQCEPAQVAERTMAKGQARTRPTFELRTKDSRDDTLHKIRCALAKEQMVQGLVLSTGRVELVPHPSKQNLWSPQLTVDISDEEESTAVKARFGPHPHVWTLYVALHAIGAIGTLGTLIFGLSQHLAGETPWALWLLPIAPVLAALVWGLAFVGQWLGAEQMCALRRFLERAICVCENDRTS